MFVARLLRLEGEYVIVVPHEEVVHSDLHEGQVVSITIEPLDQYVKVDGEQSEPATARWKLNDERSTYDGSSRPTSASA